MKFFVITFICVFRGLLFVRSEQLYTKIQQAFCKLQCPEENITASSSCSNASDCECNRALLPNLDSISMTAYGKGNIKVKCKSYDMVFIEWNDDFNPFNKNNTNVYFLHVTTVNNEFFTDMISCHYHSIKGLKPNTPYTISLWGVDNDHHIFVSKPLNVRTNGKRTPLPVTNISLNLKPEAKHYEGDLQWTPAKDLSCFYEIMVFRMDFSFTNVDNIPPPQIYDIIPTPELFTIHIEKLEFGYPYDVLIKSRGSESGRTSDNIRYTFRIPSCLAAHQNLTLCAPAKPENFTVLEIPCSGVDETETDLFDIQLAWSRPSLIPDYYIAELVVYNTSNHVSANTNMTIPGEKYDAIFRKMKIGASYQVHLQAISSGGKSPRAILNRFSIPPNGFVPKLFGEKNKSETSRHSEDGKMMRIFIGTISILLVFVISSTLVIYTRRRRQYSKKIEINEKEILEKQFSKSIFHQIGKPDKWEIPFEKLSFQSHLGEGHFGVVYSATLGGKPVACKILKDHDVKII
ncbi:hypothetical protein WA026_011784 [Henosepilachna vigintioctopunctata]|uniref:Fibronectin type-III domain-containing protein n=2 Tax=Henosepilachna vigintioctopunctata TaxID=420089 RepID=A0AAW1UKC4_9CUCU